MTWLRELPAMHYIISHAPRACTLPREIADALIRAASLTPGSQPGCSAKRTEAINEVIQKAKTEYPHLFKGN